MTVVSNTPRTERVIPCHMMGFTDAQSVSKPPEKRMKLRATIPMNCASPGSLNGMPPIPSEPASIPTARKRTSVGTPILSEVFPASTLMKISTEPIRRIFSAVTVKGTSIKDLKI